MDALQITLTLLHSTGARRENDRAERQAGREGMEMEKGKQDSGWEEKLKE